MHLFLNKKAKDFWQKCRLLLSMLSKVMSIGFNIVTLTVLHIQVAIKKF